MMNEVLRAVRHRLGFKIQQNRRSVFSPRFDTSDIKQEALIQIWQELEARGLDDVPISSAWLNAIGNGHHTTQKRHHLAAKRSVECEQAITEQEHNDDPAMLAENLEDVRRLKLALNLLQDDEKNILRLRFFEQQSFPRIAAQMKLREHEVRRSFGKILQRLRHVLTE